MENRLTLRLPKALNDLLEKEKANSGLSKNKIILKALKQLKDEQERSKRHGTTY